jgi:hypothetical protein
MIELISLKATAAIRKAQLNYLCYRHITLLRLRDQLVMAQLRLKHGFNL